MKNEAAVAAGSFYTNISFYLDYFVTRKGMVSIGEYIYQNFVKRVFPILWFLMLLTENLNDAENAVKTESKEDKGFLCGKIPHKGIKKPRPTLVGF